MKPRCNCRTLGALGGTYCVRTRDHKGPHTNAYGSEWDQSDAELLATAKRHITSLRKQLAASRAMVASYRETGKPSNVVHKLKPRCGAPVGRKNSMHIHWCTRPQGHNGRHRYIVTIDNMELHGSIQDKLKQLRKQAYLETSRAIIREYEQQMEGTT